MRPVINIVFNAERRHHVKATESVIFSALFASVTPPSNAAFGKMAALCLWPELLVEVI